MSKVVKQHLPDDMIYEVLLKSDIKTIDELCYSNKKYVNVCKNEQFWFTI